MATIMGWHDSAAVDDLTVDPEQRPLLIQLYLDRLARLVRLEAADITALSAKEQRRLRTWAVVGAIEMLTVLGTGPRASALLRLPGRAQPRRSTATADSRAGGEVNPESELA